MNSLSKARVPSVDKCREELHTILLSGVFRQAENLSRLLNYVCEKRLLGQAENVTEYTIAVDVFGKPRDFRDGRDSSVRVDMHRLRKRLALYYRKEGAGHALRIVIPLGSYVPDFQTSQGQPLTGVPPQEPDSQGIEAIAMNCPVTNSDGPTDQPAGANNDTGASMLPEPPPAGKPAWSRRVLATFAALLVVVVAVGMWMVREHTQSGAAGRRFCQPLPAGASDKQGSAYSGRVFGQGVERCHRPPVAAGPIFHRRRVTLRAEEPAIGSAQPAPGSDHATGSQRRKRRRAGVFLRYTDAARSL